MPGGGQIGEAYVVVGARLNRLDTDMKSAEAKVRESVKRMEDIKPVISSSRPGGSGGSSDTGPLGLNLGMLFKVGAGIKSIEAGFNLATIAVHGFRGNMSAAVEAAQKLPIAGRLISATMALGAASVAKTSSEIREMEVAAKAYAIRIAEWERNYEKAQKKLATLKQLNKELDSDRATIGLKGADLQRANVRQERDERVSQVDILSPEYFEIVRVQNAKLKAIDAEEAKKRMEATLELQAEVAKTALEAQGKTLDAEIAGIREAGRKKALEASEADKKIIDQITKNQEAIAKKRDADEKNKRQNQLEKSFRDTIKDAEEDARKQQSQLVSIEAETQSKMLRMRGYGLAAEIVQIQESYRTRIEEAKAAGLHEAAAKLGIQQDIALKEAALNDRLAGARTKFGQFDSSRMSFEGAAIAEQSARMAGFANTPNAQQQNAGAMSGKPIALASDSIKALVDGILKAINTKNAQAA